MDTINLALDIVNKFKNEYDIVINAIDNNDIKTFKQVCDDEYRDTYSWNNYIKKVIEINNYEMIDKIIANGRLSKIFMNIIIDTKNILLIDYFFINGNQEIIKNIDNFNIFEKKIDLDILMYLLQNYIDINNNQFIIAYACCYGMDYLINIINICEAIDIHVNDELALRNACKFNQVDVVEYLLTNYDNINVYACNNYSIKMTKNMKIFKLLINNYEFVFIQDDIKLIENYDEKYYEKIINLLIDKTNINIHDITNYAIQFNNKLLKLVLKNYDNLDNNYYITQLNNLYNEQKYEILFILISGLGIKMNLNGNQFCFS